MRLIVVLFLFISTSGFGQWKDYMISVRGDTLNRVDLKGLKQGPWTIKMPDLRGERGHEAEGYFLNDMKEGVWKKYSLQGVKIGEENYRWGKLHGKQEYFTYNGGLERIENWRAIDPANAYDTVPVYDINDPSKILRMVVVKNEGVAMKHGKWIYYDPIWGRVEATEMYVMNKLQIDDGSMADGDDIRPIEISKGKAVSDSLRNANDPALLKIKEYEKENSGKKKIKVRDGNTGNLPKP